MLWFCLVACESLLLPQASTSAGVAASPPVVTVVQSDATARVSIGPEPFSGSVTVDQAADAPGLNVSIVKPAHALPTGATRVRYQRASGRVRFGRTILSSGFGMRHHPLYGGERFHQGIDLAAPFGAPVFAPGDGVVGMAGWRGGYGLLVTLDHARGLQTRYGHMSRLSVVPGQYVRKGELLGYIGATGVATGPHLHYEVRANGVAVNPLPH